MPAPVLVRPPVPLTTPDWVELAPAALNVSNPPLVLMFAALLMLPPALSVTPSCPTVELTFEPALNTMLFEGVERKRGVAACGLGDGRRNRDVAGLTHWYRQHPVVTATLVPAFSAFWMLAVVTIALSADENKFETPTTLVSLPAA